MKSRTTISVGSIATSALTHVASSCDAGRASLIQINAFDSRRNVADQPALIAFAEAFYRTGRAPCPAIVTMCLSACVAQCASPRKPITTGRLSDHAQCSGTEVCESADTMRAHWFKSRWHRCRATPPGYFVLGKRGYLFQAVIFAGSNPLSAMTALGAEPSRPRVPPKSLNRTQSRRSVLAARTNLMWRVSDAGPIAIYQRALRAGVRKPRGKEPVVGGVGLSSMAIWPPGGLCELCAGRQSRPWLTDCSWRSEDAAVFEGAIWAWRSA